MERYANRPTGHLQEIKGHRLLNENSGSLAWLACGAAVAIYDALAPETMSHAAQRALNRNRVSKIATTAAIATVALHLTRSFDKAGIPDPMVKIVGRIRRRT